MTTATEQELITQVVLDYYEGWFDADPGRMERAVHRDLVKRQAGERLGVTTAERMVELAREGAGRADAADRRLDVEVEDVYGDIANVTVRAAPYYEYLHLVRARDGWKIANVLYQTR